MGFSSGCDFKTKLDFNSLKQWWDNPKRKSDVIAFETYLRLDTDGSFIIRHYRTDICQVLPGNESSPLGVVKIIKAFNSYCTRYRLNRILKATREKDGDFYHIFRWTGDCEQVISYVPRSEESVDGNWRGLIIPANGFRTDFRPTLIDQCLSIGCRLGNIQAANTWAESLKARGYAAMAKAVLDRKGERYACTGRIRRLTKEWQALKEEAYATNEQQKQGYQSGRYLVDPEAKAGPWFGKGQAVRALTMWDVLVEGIDPNAKEVHMDGKLYQIVDIVSWFAARSQKLREYDMVSS